MKAIARIEIAAGAYPRHRCPVRTRIPGHSRENLDRLRVRDPTGGSGTPVQGWTADGETTEIEMIIDGLPAGESRCYEIVAAETPDPREGVEIERRGDDTLHVSVRGEPFTSYHYGAEVVRPYFHSLHAAGGARLTRGWPMEEAKPGESTDHPHHKGVWTAHGDVDGSDNWSEGADHGRQVHRGFVECYSGAVSGGFVERLEWCDHTGVPRLAETREVRIYALEDVRLLDYSVTLHAKLGSVLLGDTKEAGLISVRVASSMDASGEGRILNAAGGVGESLTWGRRARWCDYSGPVGRRVHGVCVMDHPGNPRHPTHWHVRDYGLMTANCFGIHDFTANADGANPLRIPQGEDLTWRYRVCLHPGAGSLEKLDGYYNDLAQPPLVVIP